MVICPGQCEELNSCKLNKRYFSLELLYIYSPLQVTEQEVKQQKSLFRKSIIIFHNLCSCINSLQDRKLGSHLVCLVQHWHILLSTQVFSKSDWMGDGWMDGHTRNIITLLATLKRLLLAYWMTISKRYANTEYTSNRERRFITLLDTSWFPAPSTEAVQ